MLKAAANVNEIIAPRLVGMDACHQAEIDAMLLALDGTPNKGRLGANAILGVSMAVARAAAEASSLPLYRLSRRSRSKAAAGSHDEHPQRRQACRQHVDFQEFMVMPVGAPTFAEALRYGAETFHALSKLLKKKVYITSVGDEGGFAPNLKSNEEACELIIEAIAAAGLKPGKDVAIALDPASSSFFSNGRYELAKSKKGSNTADEMITLFQRWIDAYPIVSIEDGLDENDWPGFTRMTAAMDDRVQIVGDDIFVTNPAFVRRGIAEKTANAVLIKLNQIGTVSETTETIALCQAAGWRYVISHRSGETEDTFIADFSVAMGGGQIKTGSACRGERIAKYNRLLEIEMELGDNAVFFAPFSF